MIIAVPKETVAGETRVALVPDLVPKLVQAKLDVRAQSGAGLAAGYLDSPYSEKGCTIVSSDVLDQADVVLKVQPPTPEETERFKPGAVLIGLLQPYFNKA